MPECTRCASPLTVIHHRTPDGSPLCRRCADREPVVDVYDDEKGSVHEDAALKAKRPGEREPFLELKSGESLEYRTGTWRSRVQRVDPDNDQYDKIVTDQETGEIIHECHEPLSQHKGRGSAKRKSRRGGAA